MVHSRLRTMQLDGRLAWPYVKCHTRGSLTPCAKGAEVNADGGEHGSALHAGLLCHHDNIVELLLCNGARVIITT